MDHYPTEEQYWGMVLLLGDARGKRSRKDAGEAVSAWSAYLSRADEWCKQHGIHFDVAHFTRFLRDNDLLYSEEEKREKLDGVL